MILDVFGLRGRRHVHLIGGGGKTTLMFAAAQALAAEGRAVVTTTTTRIAVPEPAQSDRLVLVAGEEPVVERVRAALAAGGHVTVAAPGREPGKVAGITLEQLHALVDSGVADHVLVEADGSAGRSLKAHARHEPVVSPRADLVVAVVGVDCLGAPMDDAHLHRAALLRERLGRPPDALVTPADVAEIVLRPDGYLARVPAACEVIVLLNKAAAQPARADAEALAAALRARDHAQRLARIVIGDARSGWFAPA